MCWFAILICQKNARFEGGHANLYVSRGGRGEHGVGTSLRSCLGSHANLWDLLKVSRGGRGEHGVGTGFAVLGASRKSIESKKIKFKNRFKDSTDLREPYFILVIPVIRGEWFPVQNPSIFMSFGEIYLFFCVRLLVAKKERCTFAV